MRLSQFRVAVTSAGLLLVAAFAGCGQPPAGAPAEPAAAPAAPLSGAAQVDRGRMLIIGGGCHDCHTPKKIGPNGPEADMSRTLSGHPQSDVDPAPFKQTAGEQVDDARQRSPDGVERCVGRVVCREPDAGPEHRPRHLDRGHVRRGDQEREAHGQGPPDPAADAVDVLRAAARRGSESDVRVPEVDPADRQSRAGAARTRRQADRGSR